jgi:niacin transporter
MTNQTSRIKIITIAGLLSAIGILIPMIAPKIIIPPASFTLASHVAVFIAMFISPPVAIAVAAITAFGFFIAGVFPLVVVLRALSHLIFATLGAYLLKKNGNILLSVKSTVVFALLISVVHAVAEVVVVSIFYMNGSVTYTNGYFISVILLVGVGAFIHSLIDFTIAVFVWKPLQHVISIPANAKIRAR